jgi:hypothetical protein
MVPFEAREATSRRMFRTELRFRGGVIEEGDGG